MCHLLTQTEAQDPPGMVTCSLSSRARPTSVSWSPYLCTQHSPSSIPGLVCGPSSMTLCLPNSTVFSCRGQPPVAPTHDGLPTGELGFQLSLGPKHCPSTPVIHALF